MIRLPQQTLSVSKEQSLLLSQFQRNIDAAETRLNMTDQTLQESVNVLMRFAELSTMARNGALNAEGHMAIAIEMKQLKEVLLGLANTTDANGVGIFSGYNGVSRPFEMAVDGSVEYLGNRGQNHLQISENMTVATNIDGGSAFMRVNTDGERRSLFDIVDSALIRLKRHLQLFLKPMQIGLPTLHLNCLAVWKKWSFALTGSKGSVDISASINEGGLQNLGRRNQLSLCANWHRGNTQLLMARLYRCLMTMNGRITWSRVSRLKACQLGC